jgi:predicted signal transduction protein with EAL and GGDEF domain
MTASAGNVNYPRDGENCEVIMHAADVALYRAKAVRRSVAISDRTRASHTQPGKCQTGRSTANIGTA